MSSGESRKTGLNLEVDCYWYSEETRAILRNCCLLVLWLHVEADARIQVSFPFTILRQLKDDMAD